MKKVWQFLLAGLGLFVFILLVNYFFFTKIYSVEDQLNKAGIVFIQDYELDAELDKLAQENDKFSTWWSEVKKQSEVEVVPLDEISPYPLYNDKISEINNLLPQGVLKIVLKNQQGQYDIDGIVGTAFVLTNDGWLATWPEFFKQNVELLDNDGNQLEIEYFFDDPSTGVRFVKVAGDNLSVLKFANDSLVNGQFLLTANFQKQVFLGNLLDKHYTPQGNLWNTEVLSRRYWLDFDKELLLGSPVFNFNGDVVAILSKKIDKGYEALPVQYLGLHLNEIYNKEWSNYGLGLKYKDLAYSLYPVNGLSEGAYILENITLYQDKEKSEVLRLFKGDIITEVDGQKLSKNLGLVDLLHQYKAGQVLDIKVWRQDKELEFKLYLGL